jgi:hypothetical protein
MGHESIVYGYIEGSTYRSDEFRKLQRLNRAVIASLPVSDEWPFLTRQLFFVPGEDYQDGTYRSQVIHFGGSFKEIEYDWEKWLTKFERLLARLYWLRTRVHLDTELGGTHSYNWVADRTAIEGFALEPPTPTANWTFDGGPRSFS